MLALNLRSGHLIARAVVPAMLKQRGSDRDIASKAAVITPPERLLMPLQTAAVAMIDSLPRLEGTGVRANSILPSIIDTE